jgi:hemolysin III
MPDPIAIFLLIASTYTQFTLGVLCDARGWRLFGLAWGLAALDVTLKAEGGVPPATTRGSSGSWVAAAVPLWSNMPIAGILWLLA